MFEEEQRIGKGFTISDEKELDQILLGANKSSAIHGIGNKRPVSAYNAKTTSESDRYILTSGIRWNGNIQSLNLY